jgi:branched-subunit amino acid ABC-type transport system permease component
MDNLFTALFEIMSFASIVVLVVLGLGIIASMMGIFNFAQGEFVLLGGYITYVVHNAGAPVWALCWSVWWCGGSTPRRLSRCSAPMRSG